MHDTALLAQGSISAENAKYLPGIIRNRLTHTQDAEGLPVRIYIEVGERAIELIEGTTAMSRDILWEMISGTLIDKAPKGDCVVKVRLETE